MPTQSDAFKDPGDKVKSLAAANKYLGARIPGLRIFRESSGYFYFDSDSGNPPPSIYSNSIRYVSASDLDEAIKIFNQQKQES